MLLPLWSDAPLRRARSQQFRRSADALESIRSESVILAVGAPWYDRGRSGGAVLDGP